MRPRCEMYGLVGLEINQAYHLDPVGCTRGTGVLDGYLYGRLIMGFSKSRHYGLAEIGQASSQRTPLEEAVSLEILHSIHIVSQSEVNLWSGQSCFCSTWSPRLIRR